MKLANDERETIITFDETPADAIVFTYSKSWQKHIEGKLGIRGTPNGFGGKEYRIPKGRIRMPMVRKLSAARDTDRRWIVPKRAIESLLDSAVKQ